MGEQERFWAGEFGDSYTERNNLSNLLASNVALFSRIFSGLGAISSVIEFGSNVGLNLKALNTLFGSLKISAVEINAKAVEELKKIQNVKVYHQSLLTFTTAETFDFVLVKGVLIHIAPENLGQFYDVIFNASSKYICLAEYYSPKPVEISYHGHEKKLFKRDFAGEMLERFKNLRLVDYGFVYHRDEHFPQDDINWFVLEKQ